MDKFVAEFDPLAALDAEYAAVVARERAPETEQPEHEDPVEKEEPEPAQSGEDDDDDDPFDGGEMYAPLPADSDEEFADEDEEEDETNHAVRSEPAETESSAAPPPPMDASTKSTIMAAMQTLKLQPPPWAQDADIADDELVEIVQRRLRVGAASQTPTK